MGLEEVFVFDSKSENRDRTVEAVKSVSEARLGLGLGAVGGFAKRRVSYRIKVRDSVNGHT